jgi:vitamin B12 transporter
MPPPLPLCLRTAIFAGVSILPLAYPQAAGAQTAADRPGDLQTIPLRPLAPVETVAVAGQLPGIVVTATRSPERIEDLVADISVMDGDLDRRGLNLQEVLRFGGGVQLTSYGGPAATSNVLIRGANAGHTLTLFEGFRVSSSLLGQTTFETLPIAHVQRLELLRGPGSALYGADALGGVVQLFAPRASQGLQVDGEASAGQEGTRRLQAGLSGGSDTLSGGIRLSRDSSDGFNATTPNNFAYNPDRDGYRRSGVSAYGDARLGSGTRLRGILLQNRLSADYDDGTFPGARVKARMELVGLTGTHDIDPLTQVAFRIGQSTDKSDNRSSFPGEFTSRQLQYGLSATRQLSPAARAQVLLERLEERASSTSYTGGSSVKRITDSVGLVLLGDQGPHLMQASVRLDHSDQYDSQTNYSLSYGYRLGGGLRAGAGYATGFHAPGFNDLYFPNYGRSVIRPERSRSAEVGLYWNQPSPRDTASSTGSYAGRSSGTGAAGDRAPTGRDSGPAGRDSGSDTAAGPTQGWHAKAVLFQSRVRDLISYTAVCPDPSPEFSFGCASNVDRARIEGLSLGIGQGRPGAGSLDTSGFGWYLNVDFLDPRDRTSGTRLARRAARQLTAGTEYGRGATSIGADLVVASHRFDDAANLSELGGFAVLNLRAAYKVSREWEAFATVNNAGDRNYATARDYVQQGRLVMLGARYQSR